MATFGMHVQRYFVCYHIICYTTEQQRNETNGSVHTACGFNPLDTMGISRN